MEAVWVTSVLARSRVGSEKAVILRILAPIFTGQLDETGQFSLETIVPDLNGTATRPLARVDGVKPGDTMVVTNLDNGERGCGYVSQGGTVRTGLPADTRNPRESDGIRGQAGQPGQHARDGRNAP